MSPETINLMKCNGISDLIKQAWLCLLAEGSISRCDSFSVNQGE